MASNVTARWQLGGICHLSPIGKPNAPQLPPRTAAFSPKIRIFSYGKVLSTQDRLSDVFGRVSKKNDSRDGACS